MTEEKKKKGPYIYVTRKAKAEFLNLLRKHDFGPETMEHYMNLMVVKDDPEKTKELL